MRVALIGSPQACARLRSEVEGTFAIAGTFPDLASARAAAADVDAFVVHNTSITNDKLQMTNAVSLVEGTSITNDELQMTKAVTLVEPLTEREIEVLGLLAEGLPNKGIAARLGISDQTVKFHVASISGKLGTHTRTETVRKAVRTGLITL